MSQNKPPVRIDDAAPTRPDAQQLLEELAAIAFSNVADFANAKGRLDLDLASRSPAVRTIEVTKEPFEEPCGVIEMHDRVAALDRLAEHLGPFTPPPADDAWEDSPQSRAEAIRRLRETLGLPPDGDTADAGAAPV